MTCCIISDRPNNFYPRSPCGERLICGLIFLRPLGFLSTLSLRRATINRSAKVSTTVHFYPRSPCGERLDTMSQPGCATLFLSTLSLRRATLPHQYVHNNHTFLSTLSLRRATSRRVLGFVDLDISIHALLAESDEQAKNQQPDDLTFLSTLSLRRATALLILPIKRPGFLSTLSLRRATRSHQE